MTSNDANHSHPRRNTAPSAGNIGEPSSKPNLRLLWQYGCQYLRIFPKHVVLLVALSLGQSLVMVSTSLLLGKITTGIKSVGEAASKAQANSTQLIWFYILWLCCAFGGIGLTIGLRYCETALDLRMVNTIRERLFSSIIRQRPAFFHANDPGRLSMVVNQMSIDAQMAFRQVVLEPFFQAFSFLLGVSGLLYSFGQLQQGDGSNILWIGVAVVLVIALLSPLAVGKLGNRLQASSKEVVEQNLAIASLVTSSLKSPEEVQAFNAEDFFISKYQAVLEKVRQSRIRQTLTVETVNTLNSLPTVLIQVLFIGVAVVMVVVHPTPAAQAGYLISVLLLVPQIMGPIQAISNYMILLRSSWPSVETVLDNLSDSESGSHSSSAIDSQKPAATLEAKNLIFRYRSDLPPVFNNASFTVPPGKITGLVAKMGQGKTTFFRLALGFYQPESGQILLGGRPSSEYPLKELRQHAVMMAQFPAFFHDSLRDNLRLAKPDAIDQELRTLCEKTGVWPILVEKVGNDEEKNRYPNPLDRTFGGGEMLSGGQKKLLALTRCLLRSPSFLFLDEPTVGMDNIEKFDLVNSLRNACQDKTVMVVDHDIPWLLRFCDYFLVLDAGQIVQRGTAEELLSTEGLFNELYNKAKPRDDKAKDFRPEQKSN